MAQWKVNYKDLVFGPMIGKGNFGEVYKGTWLGTDVAIKKLYFVDDEFMQKYIEREMDALTCLSHPNIVLLMGLCIGMDDMYIITEFINGGDLRSKLKDESITMDWRLRMSILRDIAIAMNYLHAKGIIHRDLKANNLLVTDDWTVKVCDFGLARAAPEGEEQKGSMTIVGTNQWMAPEVSTGEAYDGSADVFSFAMVMYELITREKPPMRKLRDCYAFKEDDFKPHIPADTPPRLWDLLCECAATSPKDRPNFGVIIDRLKDILDNVSNAEIMPGSAKKKSGAKKAKKKSKKDHGEDGKKKKKKEKGGDDEGGEGKKKKKKSTPTEANDNGNASDGAETKPKKKKKKTTKAKDEGADADNKGKKKKEKGEKKEKKEKESSKEKESTKKKKKTSDKPVEDGKKKKAK